MRVLLLEPRSDARDERREERAEGEEGFNLPGYVLADYAQYHLALYGFIGESGFGRADPVFRFESSFQDTFRPFMRCAKPLQSREMEGVEMRQDCLAAGRPRCIDGFTALEVADALRRSPFAYAVYQNHRNAGGAEVASTVVSCNVLATTEEDFVKCVAAGQ